MSEHSKIPLPRPGEGKSLLERAVKTFDLGTLGAPPVPTGIAPVRARPPVRQPSVEAPVALTPPVPVAVVAPVIAEVATPPAAVPAPVAMPAPVAAPAPVIVPAPAVSHGPHYAIDREHLRTQGLILPEGTVTELLEEFRIVKRQLLLQAAGLARQGGGAAAQRILISSPHPGEGKTYCSLNLALSIAAEKENEVLLVDADFAKPSILSALGLPGGPGFMDALTNPAADVADFVLATDVPGLSVLPAGNSTTADSEYLNSSRTGEVLDRLTQGAPQRIVIFDSPPALAAAPAAELAKFVGQAVMIVRADRTGQGALEDAISLLSGCPNIQLLLNSVNFSPSGRRFGSYYGYGK
jgi:Mrp family chromosome partitioning ATPase